MAVKTFAGLKGRPLTYAVLFLAANGFLLFGCEQLWPFGSWLFGVYWFLIRR